MGLAVAVGCGYGCDGSCGFSCVSGLWLLCWVMVVKVGCLVAGGDMLCFFFLVVGGELRMPQCLWLVVEVQWLVVTSCGWFL